MSFPNPTQHPGAGNSCRITLGQANQVIPKVPLLRILQAAGAQGDTFTLKEVMHFLGQYILGRQLYDKRQQHLVHCGGDQLGELLGLQSFSLRDPSPVYEMLKRNLSPAALPGRLLLFHKCCSVLVSTQIQENPKSCGCRRNKTSLRSFSKQISRSLCLFCVPGAV
ncbi:protein Mdm4-like [Cyanistes caeruleus]|nr:protein Mdm4-like [Cyanistes caeruleus]